MDKQVDTIHKKRRLPEEDSGDDTEDEDVDEEALLKTDDEAEPDTAGAANNTKVDTAKDKDDIDNIAKQFDSTKIQDSISDVEEGENEESTKPDRGLELRDYQMELAELAVQGVNTIVHAVTGAGKTRIALYIVKDHLDKNPEGKVAFMAEKNFLVNQHFRSLKKILPEYMDKTYCVSAEKETSDQLNLLIDSYQIFLLTPAVLDNALKENGRRVLTKFTLMVFDECHHTKKKSPYNRLMINYHMLKAEGVKTPQILGLTATLDAQKANTVETAVEKGITVMANLDVKRLSTVIRHKESYDKFRKDISIENHAVRDTTDTDAVYRCIARAMDKTEELMCSGQDRYEVEDLDVDEVQRLIKALSNRGADKFDQGYNTWISDVESTATVLLGKAPDIANILSVGASYLKIYNEVLHINDELTGACALQSLQKKLESKYLGQHSRASSDNFESRFADIAVELKKEMAMVAETVRPTGQKKIDILLEIIRKQIETDTRFIVLVKTRELAEMLNTLLQEEGIKCAAFTGSSASSEVGGTSKVTQEKTVKEFNEGIITGLIATNILEEGLDIPDCDNVINYGYVGNEISTRQTTGRIRKKSGKHVVIASNKDSIRHKANLRRGFLMDEAVGKILRMEDERLLAIIKTIQTNIIEGEKQREAESKQAKRPRLENSRFKMICKSCSKFEVDCSTIRTINEQHHVSIDPTVLERTTIRPFPNKPRQYNKDILCEGKLFGAGDTKNASLEQQCIHELGVVSSYKGVRLPFLSYKLLAVLDTVSRKATKLSKWDEAPFKRQALTDEELFSFVSYTNTSTDIADP